MTSIWAGVEKDAAVTSTSSATVASPGSLDCIAAWTSQDYMLGDWNGYRTKLSKEHGVDFEFDYFGAVPTNLDGGIKTGSTYEGAFLATADIDMQKLADVAGGRFHVGSLFIHGNAFSPKFVGDSNQVSLIDLRHSFRLWELWYEQKFLDDKLSIKGGLLGIDRDFIVPDLYSNLGSINFLNQTFFYPTMAFNVFERPFLPDEHHALASTPYTAPGVRVKVDINPRFYVQSGVYGGNPDRTYHGTSFDLTGQPGVLSYYEAGYRSQMAPGDKGLPGSYKIGGYYQTGDFSDNDALQASYGLLSSGQVYHDNYGLYFLAEQMLYRVVGPEDPAQKGLIGFLRGAYAPPDRNLYEFSVDGGFVFRGPIPGRDFDTCGIAASYMAVSHEIRDVQRTINDAIPGSYPIGDYEAVIEADYKIQVTPWLSVQTSVQRVFHPGGQLSVEIPDATILIVQTGLRF